MDKIAIGYARVSTDKQESIPVQQARIAAWCEAHGYTLEASHQDQLSGKAADNRPGLQAALADVKRVRGVLVVYSLSRFSRSTQHCLAMVDQLAKSKCHLVSLSENIDTTTAMGEFFFTLMAGLAQLERKLIAERTLASLDAKRARGERISRHEPYGWRFVRGVLVEVPDEQTTLRQIIAWGEIGHTPGRIAGALDERGIPTKQGGRNWSPDSVRAILKRSAKCRPTRKFQDSLNSA